MKKYSVLLCCVLLFAACEKEVSILVTPCEKTVPATGGTFTVSLTATEEWSAFSSKSWVTVSPTFGEDADVQVSVAPNTSAMADTAYVSFMLRTLSTTLVVYREGK